MQTTGRIKHEGLEDGEEHEERGYFLRVLGTLRDLRV
jgi:hypothetical protein